MAIPNPNPPSNGDGQLLGYGQPQLPMIPAGTPGTYGGGVVPGAAPGGFDKNNPATWGSLGVQGVDARGTPQADKQHPDQQQDLNNGFNWGVDQAGNKPWLNRYQSTAETRSNYQYGGSANGAQDFNAQVGGASGGQDIGFNQILTGAHAGQATAGGGQGIAGEYQFDAASRNPAAFLDKQSMGNNDLDRNRQLNAYNGLQGFVNAGPGPSAAQAQLNMATDASMGNSLALARSGRGMGGSAAGLRQAIGQNAQTQQMAGNQSAMLRAQEDQAWKQNQLGAYGQMGNLAGQARQGDLSAASYFTGSKQGAQNANDQTGLGYGQLGLGYGNLGLGYGNLQNNAQNAKAAAQNSSLSLQNDVNKSALNANQNYEQNVQNYYLGRPAAQNKSTDYTPYLAAGGAVLGSFFGPAGTVAGGAVGGAVGTAVS